MKRPSLVLAAKGSLSRLERFQIAAVRGTFKAGLVDRVIRILQREVGARWVNFVISRVTHFHHWERLPTFDPRQSYIFVCNHRSLFDMFPIFSAMVQREVIRHRFFFPVRADFFYDNVFGFLINGLGSFFAMYPPVFRQKRQAAMNVLGLDEMVWLLQQGGTILGIHPEGTRNKGNPYELLPFKGGVGRIAYMSRASIVPMFTNGLETDRFGKQVRGALSGNAVPVHVVFGAPVPLDDLLARPRSPKVFAEIVARSEQAVRQLAREEHVIRYGSELPAAAQRLSTS